MNNKEKCAKLLHNIIKSMNDFKKIETVEFDIKNYDGIWDCKNPKENHNNWMKNKLKDGWIYGEKKDLQKKTHPCLVPYNELPFDEVIKDIIAQEIVNFYNNEKKE